MQNDSLDSFYLEDYVLDTAEFFSDYIIQEEKFKDDAVIYTGVMKNTTQAVKIIKRPFHDTAESRQRFKALMASFHQGIVLADNIFLSYENQEYFLYVVEPLFTSYKDKFLQLSNLLKLELDYFKKHRLFQNLVIIVKSLHALGEAHLEICPKNIWVEDQFLVYLRPFKIKPLSTGPNRQPLTQGGNVTSRSDAVPVLPKKISQNSKYWYVSPEQIMKRYNPLAQKISQKFADLSSDEDSESDSDSLNNSQYDSYSDTSSDMWSLGCVFAEMFVSLTPIFQSVDTFDRILRYFEVLGIPKKEDIFYMEQNIYESILENLRDRTEDDESEFPLMNEFVRNINKNEAKVLTTLLHFNPNKRPKAELLIHYNFFKNYFLKKGKDSNTPGSLPLQASVEEPNETSLNTGKKSVKKSNRSESREQLSSMNQGSVSHEMSQDTTSKSTGWWNFDPINTPKWDSHPDQSKGYNSQARSNGHQDSVKESSQAGNQGYRYESSKKKKDVSSPYEANQYSHQKRSAHSSQRKEPQQQSFANNEPEYLEYPRAMMNNLSNQKGKKAPKQEEFDHDGSQNWKNQQFRIEKKNWGTYQQNQSTDEAQLTDQDDKENVATLSEEDSQHEIQMATKPESVPRQQPKKGNELLRPPASAKSFQKAGLRNTTNLNAEKLTKSNQMVKSGPMKQEQRGRFAICIETIKNVYCKKNDGVFLSCRVDLAHDDIPDDSLTLFSHHAEIIERKVAMNFRGEIDVGLDWFLDAHRQRPLRIYVFVRNNTGGYATQKTPNRGDNRSHLFGVTEIDLSLMLLNSQELIWRPNEPRQLSGWYHILDPEDCYKILGQMKIDIKFEVIAQKKKMFDSQPVETFEIEQNESRNNSLYETAKSFQFGMVSSAKSKRTRPVTKNESDISMMNDRSPNRSQSYISTNYVQVQQTAQPSRSSVVEQIKKAEASMPRRESVLAKISSDLDDLNRQLKMKEMSSKREAVYQESRGTGINPLPVSEDFAHTLQKLRKILRDEAPM